MPGTTSTPTETTDRDREYGEQFTKHYPVNCDWCGKSVFLYWEPLKRKGQVQSFILRLADHPCPKGRAVAQDLARAKAEYRQRYNRDW